MSTEQSQQCAREGCENGPIAALESGDKTEWLCLEHFDEELKQRRYRFKQVIKSLLDSAPKA